MSRESGLNKDVVMATPRGGSALQWPPPGLERIHAGVWPVNVQLSMGAVATVLPLLLALSDSGPFWSAGPLGSAWWIAVATTVVGLLLLGGALIRASRLAIVAARAAGLGYDSRTIADAACDVTRDAGFVQQGLRQYAAMSEGERRALLDARLIAAFSFGAGMLWIPVAFTVSVVLAGRGFLDGVGAFGPLMLVPAGVLLLAGFSARGFDRLVSGRALRVWRRSGDDAVHRDAARWMAARSAQSGSAVGRAGRPAVLRVAAFGFGALAVALPVPIVLLALLSTVGPLIQDLVAPRMSPTTAARIVRTELLEPYALPVDESIDAREAGEILQVLSWVGAADRNPGPIERPPVRRLADPWIAAEAPLSLRRTEDLPRRVLSEGQQFTAAEREWLERASLHPGHAEIARLARAGSADIADTRWITDQFAGVSAWNLPIYRFSLMNIGAHAHNALGVLAAEKGDPATAELRFREVISMGLLLAENGPNQMDMLLGSMVAQTGADALHRLYESTGRTAEAGNLRYAMQSLERAETVAKAVGLTGPRTLRKQVDMAANEALPRGIRWESLMNAQVAARCNNANAVLFGAGEDYEAWLADVSGSLIRYPSEAALFEMIGDNRILPQRLEGAPRLLRSLFTLTFGESGVASRCADVATALALAI